MSYGVGWEMEIGAFEKGSAGFFFALTQLEKTDARKSTHIRVIK